MRWGRAKGQYSSPSSIITAAEAEAEAAVAAAAEAPALRPIGEREEEREGREAEVEEEAAAADRSVARALGVTPWVGAHPPSRSRVRSRVVVAKA